MTSRRFEVSHSHQVIFVDRLRLGCFVDLRACLSACAGDPDEVELDQQPVVFDIPRQDLAAYQRAAAAFNEVMDEHERVPSASAGCGQAEESSMSSALTFPPRRAFLRGLVTLPLIGGAVELLGNPQAVATPCTDQLLFEYSRWLSWERVAVSRATSEGWGNWADEEARGLTANEAFGVAMHLYAERDALGRCRNYAPKHTYEGENASLRSHAFCWHTGAPSASTRAALVLSAVGCDWRGSYQPKPARVL